MHKTLCDKIDGKSGPNPSPWEIFNIISYGEGRKFHRQEELHSNIIAWLFDPKQSHGLEFALIDAFLKRLNRSVPLDPDYEIHREETKSWKDSAGRKGSRRRADITIKTGKIRIFIENKWNSKERPRQIRETYELFKEKYGRHVTYIYLTKRKEPIPAGLGKNVVAADYSAIREAIGAYLEAPALLKNQAAAMLLRNYDALLKEKNSEKEETVLNRDKNALFAEIAAVMGWESKKSDPSQIYNEKLWGTNGRYNRFSLSFEDNCELIGKFCLTRKNASNSKLKQCLIKELSGILSAEALRSYKRNVFTLSLFKRDGMPVDKIQEWVNTELALLKKVGKIIDGVMNSTNK